MAKSQYPIEAKTLGEKIRKSRMDKGWTLLKVSEKAEISESYLARIEADKQMPTVKVVATLAKILHEDFIEYLNLFIQKTMPGARIGDLPKKFLPKSNK